VHTSVRWEKTKRIVDLVAGLSVIATMFFIALQWNEMRTGAADTHDLAVAAKSQADAAKSQADNTKTIADAAKSQADNTMHLATAATDQVTKLAAGVRESHALAKATQDTLLQIRKNFVKEQRPYIWLVPGDPNFEVGKRMVWNINFSNYGHSPAVHVRFCVMSTLGQDLLAVLIPENREKTCRPMMAEASNTIYPPGYVGFSTAESDHPLSADEVALIRNHDAVLGIMGKIEYEDTSGNSYESLFCSFRLAQGGITSCKSNNEIK
jgi:hypothetical protein